MAKAKASANEVEERIDTACRMLVRGLSRRAVLQHAATKWGVSTRQADEYLARASARLREEMARERADNLALEVACRTDLYRRALKAGQLQVAALVLRDRAALLRLYDAPPARSPEVAALVEQVVAAMRAAAEDWERRRRANGYEEGGDSLDGATHRVEAGMEAMLPAVFGQLAGLLCESQSEQVRAKSAAVLLGACVNSKIDGIRMRELMATFTEVSKRMSELEKAEQKLRGPRCGDDGRGHGDDD